MLRITVYATLIIILTMGAASAQTNKRDQRDQTDQPGLPGYTNVLRSNAERKNDKEIDRAYESTIKVVPNTKKRNRIRGAMSAQIHQRRPKTKDNECPLAASRRRGLPRYWHNDLT